MTRSSALLLLASLFLVLVATRFEPTDPQRLEAVGRLLWEQWQPWLPSAEQSQQRWAELWRRLPRRPVDDLQHRLQTDARFRQYDIVILPEGPEVARLRGRVPDDATRQAILELARHTVGIEQVIDELTLPDGVTPTPPQHQSE